MIRRWRSRRDDDLCRRTRERIQEIADGEVEPDAAELLQHVRACRRCGAELDQVMVLKQAVARVLRERGGTLEARLESAVREIERGGR